MHSINFKDINESNEDEVKNVKLKSNQKDFIETVDECLEESRIYSQWHPVAIYNHDIIIGFAMYGCFGPNRHTWIDRIIIDEKYQGKGYGKTAMKKLIEIVMKEYEVDTIYLSIVEGNEVAYNMYRSIGFKYINERDENGEFIYSYEKSKKGIL